MLDELRDIFLDAVLHHSTKNRADLVHKWNLVHRWNEAIERVQSSIDALYAEALQRSAKDGDGNG